MATFSSHLPCRIPARLLKRPFMLHSVSAKCENLQPEALSVAWRGRVARLVPSVGVLDMLCALFARLFIESPLSRFLNNEEPTISSRLSLLGGSSDHHTLKSPKSRLFDDDDLLFLPAGDFDYSQSERAIAMFNRDVDAVLLLEKSALEKMQFDGRRKMKTI
ncbi:hypothetical protein BLS_001277 [Venturia inaequalis]|uniref:Uncharacterized protein n=1 Tax=Venturia inaequalis TaxID=5025 RepID=A0A8H3ZDT9_VENIN|nr:hypothetical protein BLS_001277 [Venturia inaequalis]KAE9992573.1 hypothetical protein EG327_008587 [Venturia inaequalis]